MRLTQISAPAGLPVTVEDVRSFCRVPHNDEDWQLAALISAAYDLLDGPTGILGRAILSQTWRMELTGWPGAVILPIEPVVSVAVSWIDAADDEQDLDAGASWLVSNPGQPTVLNWNPNVVLPSLSLSVPYPVRIDMTCGYANAEAIPAAIRQAIRMMVAHWFDNRAVAAPSMSEIPLSVSALLARYRRLL